MGLRLQGAGIWQQAGGLDPATRQQLTLTRSSDGGTFDDALRVPAPRQGCARVVRGLGAVALASSLRSTAPNRGEPTASGTGV
jgi:hypothetical protein